MSKNSVKCPHCGNITVFDNPNKTSAPMRARMICKFCRKQYGFVLPAIDNSTVVGVVSGAALGGAIGGPAGAVIGGVIGLILGQKVNNND